MISLRFYLLQLSLLFYAPFPVWPLWLPTLLEGTNIPGILILGLVMWYTLINAIHVQTEALNVIVWFSPALEFMPLPWDCLNRCCSFSLGPRMRRQEEQTCDLHAVGSRVSVILRPLCNMNKKQVFVVVNHWKYMCYARKLTNIHIIPVFISCCPHFVPLKVSSSFESDPILFLHVDLS